MLMWDSWQSTSWSSKFSGLLPLHTHRPPTPLAFSLLSTLGPEHSLPLWTSCTTRFRILLLFNSGGSRAFSHSSVPGIRLPLHQVLPGCEGANEQVTIPLNVLFNQMMDMPGKRNTICIRMFLLCVTGT